MVVLLLEATLVLAVAGAVVYGTMRLLTGPPEQWRPASPPGRWRVTHYDAAGETHVVLQKVSLTGTTLLDEHVLARIRADDPEYDAKFLTAMSTARERRALFDAEDDG